MDEMLVDERQQKIAREMQEELQDKLKENGIDEGQVISDAKEDLQLWDGFNNENATRGRDDADFLFKDQWSNLERSEFDRLFKMPLVFNHLYDPVKKTIAERRKNKPDLMVRSLTGKATQQDLNIRSDLVRTFCYNSQTDLIYQHAFKSALTMGWGAFEICIDYENPRSMFRTIRFEMVEDARKSSFDPNARLPHKGDGNFCARLYSYPKEQFYATFPQAGNVVSYADPRFLLDFQWQTRDSIVVCKYSKKHWYPIKLYFLSNGDTVTDLEWEDMQKQNEEVKNRMRESIVVKDIIFKEMPTIRGERNSKDYFINTYLLTQNEIIDFTPWPSRYLPIIYQDGDSSWMDGQQHTRSFIQDAKDAQRFVNYVGSEIAAEVKNRRREQWIGTPDNIQGYEQFWRNPELQAGILLAKPDPKTNQLPTKMPPSEIPQSLLDQYDRGCRDIREILGYSETEELQGRDMSGKARRERKMEGSMSSYIYFDNADQAIEQAGRVVLDLLPFIIGEDERYMILSKADGTTQSMIFNQREGDEVKNKIERGNFDVEIATGPSFAVQKDIALEFFQQTASENPQVFNLIADLWASQLDLQQMPTIRERLKTLVPPQVLAKEEGKQLPPPQPSPQEMMMQAEIKEKQADIAVKQQKVQIEMQKLELEKAELMLKAKDMNMQNQLNIFDHKTDLEIARTDHRLKNKELDHRHTEAMASTLADLHKHHTSVKNP